MKLIVGITEAPGVAYGLRLLAYLSRYPGVETHAVISDGTKQKILSEMNWTPEMVATLTEQAYNVSSAITAFPDASKVDGAIVAPCSVESLAAIANADGNNLLAQAVNVCLRQQRRVILLVTERVLGSEHLELMLRVSQMGAVFLACPAHDLDGVSVYDMVDSTVATVLDLAGIRSP